MANNYAKLQRSRSIPQRPSKKRWLDNINNDMKSLKIHTELALHRHKQRKATQKNAYSPNAYNPR